jgi:hypothetical protein
MKSWMAVALLAVLGGLVADVQAGSRILGTGGVSPIEGGSGGGLLSWSTITGYGSAAEVGTTAFATTVQVDDFQLQTMGAAVGYDNRVELSFARQKLYVEPLDLDLKQDVFGAKVRLVGDILYTPWPQISLGVQHKRNGTFAVPRALGAKERNGTDIYLSAAKLWFDGLAGRNVFTNVTLRRTQAAETGLLGFGGPKSGYDFVFESSVALFLNDHWVLGYEYRQKPEVLDAVSEHDWQDLFVAWIPNKHVAVVAAWVELDQIADLASQNGGYLSVQAAF